MSEATEAGSKAGAIIDKADKPKLTEDQQKLRSLFYLSFRISQGGSDLQGEMFKWLKTKGHLDGMVINEDPPSYVLDIKPPKSHETQTKEPILNAINMEWEKLHLIKNKDVEEHPEQIIPEIFKLLTIREIYFQNAGRSDREASKRFESPMRNFLFFKRPTGSDAYDQLFQELVPHMEGLRSQGNPELTQLQKLWEGNHPGETFFPEPKAA